MSKSVKARFLERHVKVVEFKHYLDAYRFCREHHVPIAAITRKGLWCWEVRY